MFLNRYVSILTRGHGLMDGAHGKFCNLAHRSAVRLTVLVSVFIVISINASLVFAENARVVKTNVNAKLLENLHVTPKLDSVESSNISEIKPLAVTIATRLNDTALCELVLQSDNTLTATKLISKVGSILMPSDAFKVLRLASEDEHLASHAILQIGKIAKQVPAAKTYLLKMLSDPVRGSSAAVALVQLHDGRVINKVIHLLQESDDLVLQTKAILTLALDGSQQAKTALNHFSKQVNSPPMLRKEVTRLLRM